MFAIDRSFDPETLRILQRVFDEAAAALPGDEQTQERKSILASRILSLALGGETDPVRLRTAALLAVVPGAGPEKHADVIAMVPTAPRKIGERGPSRGVRICPF